MLRRLFIALSLVTAVLVYAPAQPASAAPGCSSTAIVETCAAAETVYLSSSHCHSLGGGTYECFGTFRMNSAWGHGTLAGNLVATLDAGQGAGSDYDTCSWSNTGGGCTVRSSSNPFQVSSSGVYMFCGGFTWMTAVGKATAVTPTGTYTDYRYASQRVFAPPC